MYEPSPIARFGGLLATDLREVTDDPAALESGGWWAVVADFEGGLVCARFGDVRGAPAASAPVPARPPVTTAGAGAPAPAGPGHPAGRPDQPGRPAPGARGSWQGPAPGSWSSSMGREAYTAAVRDIRARIADGEVYQANLCRVMSAPLPDPRPVASDIDCLAALLERGNPAPYGGTVRLPAHGVEVATASPELYLRRDGRTVTSGPIKGTGRTAEDLLEKDHAENVMIVDLVRNDLGRVCATGSVTVPALCAVEPHPGLVHLVSTVRGELAEGAGWADLLRHTFPPGSVTGAPKSSALRIIGELETAPRGPYCGGVGWIDADRGTGELAVGIRTFWIERDAPGGPVLRFGTGAGITWGSDPAREWDETELKASRLLAVASGSYAYDGADTAGTTDGVSADAAHAAGSSGTPGNREGLSP